MVKHDSGYCIIIMMFIIDSFTFFCYIGYNIMFFLCFIKGAAVLMLFNSIDFLLFFPFVTILYFILPKKIRWVWLLGSSAYFYMCWKARYILLIGFSIAVTYLGSLLIQMLQKKRTRQHDLYASLVLILVLVSNLGILFLFKYYGFFADTVQTLFAGRVQLPALQLLLPVGISFYTFQALGYCIDVYRGTLPTERNPFRYALFVLFFPQLVAGPIERAQNLLPQITGTPRSFSFEEMRRGLLLIGWGLFCKMVIADRIALFVDAAYADTANTDGSFLLLATILFALQIYCDFNSYSTIARGAAQVLGFRLMQNFNRPYFSRSMREFWRRWHISLSSWFTDYIYIPLGGSRSGKARHLFNLLFVFFISGLWHGASWTFVLWGLWNGLWLCAETFYGQKLEALQKKFCGSVRGVLLSSVRWAYTSALILTGWVFFRADTVPAAFRILSRIFTGSDIRALFSPAALTLGMDAADWVVAGISLVLLLCVDALSGKYDLREKLLRLPLPLRWSIYLLLILAIAVFGIYGPEYDNAAFIYFQF